MKWLQRGNRYLSAPYHIHASVRGWEVWLNTKSKYGVLARELPSLIAAKEFCEKHRKDATPISGAEPAGVAS